MIQSDFKLLQNHVNHLRKYNKIGKSKESHINSLRIFFCRKSTTKFKFKITVTVSYSLNFTNNVLNTLFRVYKSKSK